MAVNAFLLMTDFDDNEVIIGTQNITVVRRNFYDPDTQVNVYHNSEKGVTLKCSLDDFMNKLHGKPVN